MGQVNRKSSAIVDEELHAHVAVDILPGETIHTGIESLLMNSLLMNSLLMTLPNSKSYLLSTCDDTNEHFESLGDYHPFCSET